MIITQTPLRISFVGGGSDIDYFYKNEPGAVISTAISKYIYIIVNKKFDSKIRASYSKTEIVDKVEDLKHELIREGLKSVGIDGGIEVVSIADVHSRGTGLGSSSTYTVGLLHGLNAYQSKYVSAEELAQGACKIEIERLRKSIGKQDQYIAAYGGLCYIQFNPDETVFVEPIICSPETKRTLEPRLLMLYTGMERFSGEILARQKTEVLGNDQKKGILKKMVGLAQQMRESLNQNKLGSFGEMLDENWRLKRQLCKGISNPKIEEWYSEAKRAGASGGKICGAGGGGFLLLYAPVNKHKKIIKSLSLKPMEFSFESQGSRVIFKE